MVAAAILVALARVPAAAQDRERLQMLAELRMIQEQSGQLRALIATLEETLKALNARLEQQSDASRKSFADQKLLIDGLRDNVGIVRSVLSGERGPCRDVTLLNAGAGLYAADAAASIADGMAMAAESIDSGRALAALDALVAFSQELADERAIA